MSYKCKLQKANRQIYPSESPIFGYRQIRFGNLKLRFGNHIVSLSKKLLPGPGQLSYICVENQNHTDIDMKNIIFTFLLASCLCSCRGHADIEMRDPQIRTSEVVSSVKAASRSYSFISQPYRTTMLSFRVGGRITDFNVQNGQFFRRGQLIAAIDDRDFRINLQRAESRYRQAEADFKRIENLHERGNVSDMSYVQAKAGYEQALADFNEATNNLEDTRIYAPFDGYVQSVHIQRYQEVGPGTPVVTLIDLSKIIVEVYIPETVAALYRENSDTACTITFNTLKDRTFTPEKTFVTQSVMENNISYLMTAVLDNSHNMLFGGMSGKMELPHPGNGGAVSRILVPVNAVCHDCNAGAYVWKVSEDNVVKMTPVTLGGLEHGNMVEITEGLSEGDRIATSRLRYLSENEKIIAEG